MLDRFDQWVIVKAEIFCHWFQRWTGRTNFFLAGMFTLGEAIFLIEPLFEMASSRVSDRFALILIDLARSHWFFYLLVVMVSLRSGLWTWMAEEDAAYARLLSGLANPRKIGLANKVMRLLSVVYSLAAPASGIVLHFSPRFLVFVWLVFSVEILLALDPLPPCKSKLGEWMAVVFLKPSTQHNEGSP